MKESKVKAKDARTKKEEAKKAERTKSREAAKKKRDTKKVEKAKKKKDRAVKKERKKKASSEEKESKKKEKKKASSKNKEERLEKRKNKATQPVQIKQVEPAKEPKTIEELQNSYACDGSRTAEMEVFSAYWEYGTCGHFGNDYNANRFCGGINTKGCPNEIRGDAKNGGIIQFDSIALKKYPQIAKIKCKRATKVHFFKSEAFKSKRIFVKGKVNTKQAITLKKCKPKCYYLWHAQYKCVEFA